MRIGLVCPYNIGLGGGVQEIVLASQRELKKRGHEVHIITPLSKNAQIRSNKSIIYVGVGTDVRSPFSTTAQISASISPDEIQHIIETYRFDVLHFHEPWVPMMSRQLLLKSKSLNVATFHAKLPESAVSKTIERVINPYARSILKLFDVLTAVSEPASQYVKSLTNKPIQIIPNGVNLKRYRPARQINRESKQILHIGRLEKRKGVKYLIDAFARLNDPESELIIAGDGPSRRRLEEYAFASGLDNVKFLGYVSENEKIRLLRDATIFCSAAMYGESFGIVLLEAMACGTPVVAANNQGYASVMQGRGLISLINPQDTDQFARRLALFLYDAELAKLWRKWALNYVKQFDYPNIVDQYEGLYKKALKSRGE